MTVSLAEVDMLLEGKVEAVGKVDTEAVVVNEF